MEKNEIYEAVCDGYSSDAEGVCRIDGRVVFVKGLIDGERARVRILKAGKNVCYGKVEELLEPSPHRITPDCPVYGRCGGCATRHMDYSEELRFKERKVNDALRRIGGLTLAVEEIVPSPKAAGYRNKTIYTVGRENGRVVTGFYRARSHDLVPAPDCRIESDYAREAASALREAMEAHGVPVFGEHSAGVRRLFCRFGEKSGEGQCVVVTGEGDTPGLSHIVEALWRVPGTAGVVRNVNGDPGDTVLGARYELLRGREYIEDTLCSLTFRLAPPAFYQVNAGGAERLYGKALEFAALMGSENVLDLYCGTGTITLCLAKRARRAVGVEIVESAIENARRAASLNGVTNAEFICSDAPAAVERLLHEGFRPDVVVVDPPRKGLSEDAPRLIASLAPKRVVYVSCDPATLARDLARFAELGYAAERAAAVDMFAGTACVETCVLLSKLKSTQYIEVELKLDELDLTAAESKATYDEIKAYVLETTGLHISSLYISQVKRKLGLEVGQNYNLPKSETSRQPKCPPEKEKAITDAPKHFGMI